MATATATAMGRLEELLGGEAQDLLQHRSETIPKEMLHLPGPDFVDRVWTLTDRPTRVLRSLQQLYAHGRLGVRNGDVDEAKPAPDIFAIALERAGVPASEAVVVGDTVWDVEAASR